MSRKCDECESRLMLMSGVAYFVPDDFPYGEDKTAKEEGFDPDFGLDAPVLAFYCEKCEKIKSIWTED